MFFGHSATSEQHGKHGILQGHLFLSVVGHVKTKNLRTLLQQHGIPFEPQSKLSSLRKALKNYAKTLLRGKQADRVSVDRNPLGAQRLHEARNLWPQPVPSELKNKIANMFCEQTSSNALHRSTCACCAEAVLSSALTLVSSTDVNLEPLLKDADPTNPDNSHGNPDQYWLDSTGIVEHSVDSFRLQLCQPCMADLKHGSIPRLSLANDTYLGDVPNVLRDLTPIEESMISLCRAKCWIVQLNRIWCG